MNCSTRPAIGFNYLKKNVHRLIHEPYLPRYYKKKLKELYPDFFQIFEDNQKFRSRSDHEKYAKHILTEQKKDLHDPFRSRKVSPFDRYLEDYLEQNTISYSETLKEKKI